MDDWGLQAVVNKGFTNDCSTSTMNNYPVQSCFVPFGIQQDDYDNDVLFSSHNLFETSTVLDELEELYKPFYPMSHPLSPQSTMVTSSISVPKEMKDELKKLSLPGPAAAASSAITNRAAQSKKRNQRKKMVLQVTADGLSSDMWAWRKYGQKPIKGSPYPRSYYRCSSSKGCLARKQVEQSSSEPGMLIITYTAEHSHAHPTRRSSLAGTSRNKSSAPKKPNTTTNKPNTSTVKKHSSCCSPTTVLSPTTPLTSSMEDESPRAATKPEGAQEDAITDHLIFPSLEELDRLTSNWFSDQILPNFPCMFS
nr:WRKY [Loropetalum chinense var. rubrum]